MKKMPKKNPVKSDKSEKNPAKSIGRNPKAVPKSPPKSYSEEVKEKARSCGRVSFPVLDTCRMMGISIDDFSASKELMDAYRTAQLETSLEIRTRLLESIEKYPDSKTIKLFVEQFMGTILPDPDEEM